MLHRTWQDERGFSMVFVATGLVAFLAATTLAIDVGMFMTARAQTQNAADAGALAGATALAFDDFTNRSAAGPAVQNALQAAGANQVIGTAVSITPADVTFLANPTTGESNRVRVDVYRSSMRGNPLRTLMGSLFGVKTANVNAFAVAEAAPANTVARCAPFMIPDKWIERQTAPWDVTDTFSMYDNQNRLLANPDVYIQANEPGYTGYSAISDKGTRMVIRAGTGTQIQPTFYYSWKEGVDATIGADWYRDNIATGTNTTTEWHQTLIQEPGNMAGPTMQGIDSLIALDPNAYWDTATNSVHSDFHPSPRVVAIPLYDPWYYEVGKANGRYADFRLANWLGFFIESRSGNTVFGRITPLVGTINPNAGPAPAGAFPRAIRLVN